MEEDNLRMIPYQEDTTSVYRIRRFRLSFRLLTPLFLLLPLVSGQCSTCMGDRCYDTGQCILGCVPGYVNEYCDEACPSNCLNSMCHVEKHSGTLTCTDGCKAGYCGAKCTYPCPTGCKTCDRQCGSCNTSVCPERHYGADCKDVCSPQHEQCDRESGRCIKCIRGRYGDNCEFKCTECFSNPRNIAYGCLSGCEVCRNQDHCPGGLFGDQCELRCSINCGQSNNKAGRPCNRATGECSAGCVSGYHGLACNYTCSEHCLSGRCNRVTGECSAGCVSGYYGLTCNYTCSRFCVDGVCHQHNRVCTSGCINGYQRKLDVCEKLQDTKIDIVVMKYDVTIAVLTCVFMFLAICCVHFWFINRKISRDRSENSELEESKVPYERY